MSALGWKADINGTPRKSPLIAISGHRINERVRHAICRLELSGDWISRYDGRANRSSARQCTNRLPEAVEHWSLTTSREKLIKIGVRVVRHGRYITFQMPAAATACCYSAVYCIW